jgi:hypothetical protein
MRFDLQNEAQREQFAAKIKGDIDEFCRVFYDDGHRAHLGGSEIGNECSRRLWYGFRWAAREEFEGRMQRLFNRGHETEARFITWLEGVGFSILDVDPDTGKQLRITDCEEHFGGSLDSIAIHRDYPETMFLLEYKTHNAKSFVNLAGSFSSGVRAKKPQHWAQMCVYGFKRGIQYAVYCAINKNNDDIYIEVLKLDWRYGEELIAKANSIIFAKEPPARLSDNPAYHVCKFCPMWTICHDNKAVDKNCRSCRHAEPIEAGEWRCNFHNETIPRDFLPKGCSNHFSVQP